MENGKLEVKSYPVNICEDDWIPTDYDEQEACITDTVDRRVRADPNNYDEKNMDTHTNAIYNIVQLRMKYEKHKKVGSGVIIHHAFNRSFVLTAAHNIIDSDDGEYPNCMWIEINKNDSNGYYRLNQYSCCKYYVHPQYIELQKTFDRKTSDTGYDIGLVEVLDTDNQLKQIKPVKIREIKSETLNNITVKVVGFPGQEDVRGQLYGMVGDASIQYVNDKIKYKELLTYDIDTTPGQSGSPIFMVLDDEKKTNDIYGSFDREILAIHASSKPKKKLNFATILYDDILLWIYKCICTKTYIKRWTTYMLIMWITNMTNLSDNWKQQVIVPVKEFEITGDDIANCKDGEPLAEALGLKNKIACKRVIESINHLKIKQNEEMINDAILENCDDENSNEKFQLKLNAEGKHIVLDQWVTLETTLMECKIWYKEERGVKSEINDIDFYYLGQLMNEPNKRLAEYNLNTRNHLISVKFSANGGIIFK